MSLPSFTYCNFISKRLFQIKIFSISITSECFVHSSDIRYSFKVYSVAYTHFDLHTGRPTCRRPSVSSVHQRLSRYTLVCWEKGALLCPGRLSVWLWGHLFAISWYETLRRAATTGKTAAAQYMLGFKDPFASKELQQLPLEPRIVHADTPTFTRTHQVL